MDKFQKGAWIIHHTNKLQRFDTPGPFEKILDAGKAGKLLSALSASDQNARLSMKKVEILANGVKVSKRELSSYLKDLHKRRFINYDERYVEVYAVTSKAVLGHTSVMFDEYLPSNEEKAAIHLAEKVSQRPSIEQDFFEEISDTYELSRQETKEVIDLSKRFTFTDHEKLSDGNSLLFNGNLFKKGDGEKIYAILSSLSEQDRRLVTEVAEMINKRGCILYLEVKKVLGKPLFEKLLSIGFYDVNTVANSQEEVNFISLPESFAKYGNPLVEDGLDHAKKLVAAFTYGMNYSSHSRGKIKDVEALVRKLVNGGSVGPVQAIGQDYQALEHAGVVKIVATKNKYGIAYKMWLLKKDIGEIALNVIKHGSAGDEAILIGAKVSKYIDPETNRTALRLKQGAESKKQSQQALLTLRTL